MGKALLYLVAIIFVVAFVVGAIEDLWLTFGIWLLIVPAVAGGGLTALRLAATRDQRRRARIGRLEAAAGIPVPLEGTCARCDKPLPVGAAYCPHCRRPVPPDHGTAGHSLAAVICPACRTRNVEDARWCAACGADLGPTARRKTPRDEP